MKQRCQQSGLTVTPSHLQRGRRLIHWQKGVTLLELRMKMWEKIQDERFRKLVMIEEDLLGLQKGKSAMDAILSM